MNHTDRNHPNRAPLTLHERVILSMAERALNLSQTDDQPYRVSLARDLIAAALTIAPGIVRDIVNIETSAETAARIYGEE